MRQYGYFIFERGAKVTDKFHVLISNKEAFSVVWFLYSESGKSSVVVSSRAKYRRRIGATYVHNLHCVSCK